MIKYTYYPQETALVILTNDVLNLHLREASIQHMDISTTPDKTTVKITTKLDEDITTTGGKLYTGETTVTFDKMDISTVYPGGFSINDWSDVSSLKKILLENTRVNLERSEFIDVTENGRTFIRMKESSIFWKGELDIKLRDLPIVIVPAV